MIHRPLQQSIGHGFKQLIKSETERFAADHPKSQELFERAKKTFCIRRANELDGQAGGAFPVFVKEAKGAHFTDVDGKRYLDLCSEATLVR